ncbi:MAG TPA: hypothetical protein PKM48_12015 [Parvularculaceae bacterium]|nr:hypothetical protein [Parvularculaceae bacterium]
MANPKHGIGGEEVRQESSWRYPLGIFLATLILCAIFLYYYVGPSVDELGGNVPSPAISEEQVALTVADLNFAIPANYTVFPRDRRGGARDEVWLYALWPTLSGYAPSRRDDFVENAPDTRRVDILIAARTSPFTERERIDILYMPQTIDRRGARTPYQLIKYEFKEQRANVPTNGYSGTELYLGEDENKNIVALFCIKDQDGLPSPECWRELELSPGVSLTYRFKRPYLAEWRKIDDEVRSFVNGLKAKSS